MSPVVQASLQFLVLLRSPKVMIRRRVWAAIKCPVPPRLQNHPMWPLAWVALEFSAVPRSAKGRTLRRV
jgi:hypothetical protein